MATAFEVEQIACVCHEANRAYQRAFPSPGIPVAAPWSEFPPDQQESVRLGVRAALKGATPEQSHEGWCRHKRETGWTYGPVKDAELKTHPCLVPYDQLPDDQRRKDVLFTSIVRALDPNADVVGRRGDGEGAVARAGACEGDVPQCPALAPGSYPVERPRCSKLAGHAGRHEDVDGTTWLRGPVG